MSPHNGRAAAPSPSIILVHNGPTRNPRTLDITGRTANGEPQPADWGPLSSKKLVATKATSGPDTARCNYPGWHLHLRQRRGIHRGVTADQLVEGEN
jgi:hypothetical protein